MHALLLCTEKKNDVFLLGFYPEIEKVQDGEIKKLTQKCYNSRIHCCSTLSQTIILTTFSHFSNCKLHLSTEIINI